MTIEEKARMDEHRERVAQEERAWRTERLHRRIHGNWLGPDECPVCIAEIEQGKP